MIYLHVPFCRSFCIYCDFFSEICPKGRVPEIIIWKNAVLAEIERRREELQRTRLQGPDTLYIGGGTPSVVPLECLGEIVDSLGPGPFSEFTVEVNPDDIVSQGVDYVLALREMGVNRISMGVQSFDDSILHWMGRRHDSETAVRAVSIIREAEIDNLSIDLISGISIMSEKSWEDTVRKAISLHPEHISAYTLSIEPGSALAAKLESGAYVPCDDEAALRQEEMLVRLLSDAGYMQYEISNFALEGRRAVHNSAYWTLQSYVGLGPGAHSYDAEAGVRSWNSESLDWKSDSETLTQTERMEERIMLGLRTASGLPASLVTSLLPHDKLEFMLREHMLEINSDGSFRIPADRFFVSDDIISQFCIFASL